MYLPAIHLLFFLVCVSIVLGPSIVGRPLQIGTPWCLLFSPKQLGFMLIYGVQCSFPHACGIHTAVPSAKLEIGLLTHRGTYN